MLLNRISLFRFTVKRQLKRPGIIIEPQSFRCTGLIPKLTHWFKNTQTFSDMQRSLGDFGRKKSHTLFIQQNNKLLDIFEKRNFRDLDVLMSEQYFKQIKNSLKHNEPISANYNIFQANKATIVQGRSFTQNIIRLKSIDQWYQVIVQYENQQNKQKAYHVLQRFYKQKQWKFVKFNL